MSTTERRQAVGIEGLTVAYRRRALSVVGAA